MGLFNSYNSPISNIIWWYNDLPAWGQVFALPVLILMSIVLIGILLGTGLFIILLLRLIRI